ncbi:hypothetical protein HF576_16705 [Microbacterium sp. CFH 90308]|uniref:Uncharacterized protein n=1 Tax=Microbacterium salsuginis TaxID=2722803 RepID=A0ABX1KH90_9MICO|nr:hypothetical protein [Microbacterium sp. CFH 90308]NLP85485.1 hypothetical protein [Microbacterium sp. CFH 90308]
MTAEDPLSSPYRTVRAVRAPEDGPWPGRLVRTAEGETRVLVDAAVFASAWSGWDAAPGGHVLSPLDVVRRVDGHDVVLPVCTEPLEVFLRRRASRMPLRPGEAVTLAVSVLRGCAELAANLDTKGEWWLDDAGRPVLAPDLSARRALDAAAEALGSLVVDPPLDRAWDDARRAIGAERVALGDLLEAEDALFAAAAPEPLTTVTLSPRSAAETTQLSRDRIEVPAQERPRPTWQMLVGHVDADLADTVSRVTTGLWRRARGPQRPRRRAPWILGGAVAAAVLAGGTLWPAAGGEITATDGETQSGPSRPDSSGSTAVEGMPVPSASTTPSDPAVEVEPPDLAMVASALLDERTACGGELECLVTVLADPSTPFGGGAIDLPSSARVVTLLDDFGDVAVLRVDAGDGSQPAQLTVLVRQDEKWLLRDVHDVAQQP